MAQPLRIPRSRTHPPPEAIFGQPVVVVGMGPAGIRVAQEIIDRDRLCRVVLYEREPWAPYHRVRLSSLMLGTVRIDDIANELRLPADATRVVQHRRCTVTAIDRAAHSVSDSSGRVQSYSHLILATGSSPHIPHIRGIALRGVYTFRSLSDAQQLMARTVRSLATVVLGVVIGELPLCIVRVKNFFHMTDCIGNELGFPSRRVPDRELVDCTVVMVVTGVLQGC